MTVPSIRVTNGRSNRGRAGPVGGWLTTGSVSSQRVQRLANTRGGRRGDGGGGDGGAVGGNVQKVAGVPRAQARI